MHCLNQLHYWLAGSFQWSISPLSYPTFRCVDQIAIHFCHLHSLPTVTNALEG